MALFRKKKKEGKKAPACACSSASRTTDITNGCCPESKDNICCIKVLGSGCASCHALYENTKETVQKMGLAAEVEYVTDLQKVMEYGVISMPALIINEKAESMGKVLKTNDIEKLLHKAGF